MTAARGVEAPLAAAGWTFNRPASILPSRAREPCSEGVRILRFFPPPGSGEGSMHNGARNRGLADVCSRPIPRTCQVQIVCYFFFFAAFFFVPFFFPPFFLAMDQSPPSL